MALSHRKARQWIEKAADGLLNEDQQAALDAHLKGCMECRAYAAELAALESALGAALSDRWGQPQLSKSTEHKMVEQLQESFGAGGVGSGGGPGGLSNLARWGGALILVLLAAVGIATLEFQAAPPKQLTAELMFDMFESETPTPTASLTATATRTFTPTPAPLILVAVPIRNANCRDGASNAFEIADTLFESSEYSPIGRGFDNLWVQFFAPVNLTKCWAFIENLQLLVDGVVTPIEDVPESLLPYVAYPPTPTTSFTPVPSRTSTPTRPAGIN